MQFLHHCSTRQQRRQRGQLQMIRTGWPAIGACLTLNPKPSTLIPLGPWSSSLNRRTLLLSLHMEQCIMLDWGHVPKAPDAW